MPEQMLRLAVWSRPSHGHWDPGTRRVHACLVCGGQHGALPNSGAVGGGCRAKQLIASSFKVGPYSHSDERASFYRLFKRIFHNYNKYKINEAEGNGILVQ